MMMLPREWPMKLFKDRGGDGDGDRRQSYRPRGLPWVHRRGTCHLPPDLGGRGHERGAPDAPCQVSKLWPR